jgi:PAS domain S-box-containing protein
MTFDFEHNETPVPPPPLAAKVFAFGLCPVLFVIMVFETLQIIGAAKAGNLVGAFYANVLILLLSFCAFALLATVAAYRFAEHLAVSKAKVRETGLQRRAHYHEELLRLVTDSLPTVIFITDGEGRLWFANREAATQMKSEPEDVIGKTVDKLLPQRQAQTLLGRIRRVKGASAPVITVDRHDDATGPHYMQTYHIPLPETSELHSTVLVTQKDITDVIVERERQEQTFKQLIDTLIAVVDRRDPYAAGHSLRVGMIAGAIATELGLDFSEIEACQVAGSLMNLGKVLVPREILVKTTALSSDELKPVRYSILTSAEILSLISFSAPVIPTLRQVLERYDGTGEPERRKGENILATARVVAVANAFIALVSPRAHRAGLSIEAALESLNRDSGTVYDPHMVEALRSHIASNPETQETLLRPPPELRGATAELLAG